MTEVSAQIFNLIKYIFAMYIIHSKETILKLFYYYNYYYYYYYYIFDIFKILLLQGIINFNYEAKSFTNFIVVHYNKQSQTSFYKQNKKNIFTSTLIFPALKSQMVESRSN